MSTVVHCSCVEALVVSGEGEGGGLPINATRPTASVQGRLVVQLPQLGLQLAHTCAQCRKILQESKLLCVGVIKGKGKAASMGER